MLDREEAGTRYTVVTKRGIMRCTGSNTKGSSEMYYVLDCIYSCCLDRAMTVVPTSRKGITLNFVSG
jgi:hypothetical protein